MDREDVIDRDSSTDVPTVSEAANRAGTCGRCFMHVARYAPQVLSPTAIFHRECFEAWYFGRHGRRPVLTGGKNGDRHRFEVRDKAA